MDLTIAAQQRIEADRRLELVTAPSLGILTFRRRGGRASRMRSTDRRNEPIVRRLAAAGDVLLTSTVIRGRHAIRLCILNHGSSGATSSGRWTRVGGGETRPTARPRRPGIDRRRAHPGRRRPRLAPPHDCRHGRAADDRAVRSVADEQALRFLATGRPDYAVPVGGHRTLGAARTFYLVRSAGCRSGSTTGRSTRWGRATTSGRSRRSIGAATSIRADRDRDHAEPTTLLAFPAAALRELMAEVPRRPAIRRIAQSRLPPLRDARWRDGTGEPGGRSGSRPPGEDRWSEVRPWPSPAASRPAARTERPDQVVARGLDGLARPAEVSDQLATTLADLAVDDDGVHVRDVRRADDRGDRVDDGRDVDRLRRR